MAIKHASAKTSTTLMVSVIAPMRPAVRRLEAPLLLMARAPAHVRDP